MAIGIGGSSDLPFVNGSDAEEDIPELEYASGSILERIQKQPDGPRVVVLVPAFNEELTIGSVVLKARLYAKHVIVIDDGSRDKTAEIARAAGAEVIEHVVNRGKASALQTGFNVLKNKDFDIIVMVDGDGQHDMADIGAVIKPIVEKQADVVIGSRFLKGGNSIPLKRRIGQGILNRITNAGSSIKVTDTQSGFRAINMKALGHMDFHSSGYAVEQNMIIHCAEAGLRIVEVPISVRYDVPNGHKQSSVKMGMDLFSNIIATVGYKSPILLFGVPGVTFCTIGLLLGVATMYDMILLDSLMLQILASGFLMTIGAVLSISALMLNSITTLMRSKFKN